jgi:hypothetical protein
MRGAKADAFHRVLHESAAIALKCICGISMGGCQGIPQTPAFAQGKGIGFDLRRDFAAKGDGESDDTEAFWTFSQSGDVAEWTKEARCVLNIPGGIYIRLAVLVSEYSLSPCYWKRSGTQEHQSKTAGSSVD